MEKQTRINKLYRETFITVITIALPTMLEQIMSVLMQYVDTAMVGRLGATATAAVSTSTTITWLINSIPSAFGIGAMTLIAQAIGSGEERQIKSIARQCLYFSLLVGGVLEVVCLLVYPHVADWMGAEPDVAPAATRYFFWITVPVILRAFYVIFSSAIRATKDTKTPMYIGIATNVMNVALDYVFIYVLNLGVDGAAYATCLSSVIGAICMITAFFKNVYLRFNPLKLTFEADSFKSMWSMSLPLLGINFASCLGYVVFAGLVSHMGTIIFAAHSIALGAEELFYIGGYGFKSAANTMVGISYGEQNHEKYHAVCVSSVICTISVMTLSGVLLFIFAGPLMGFFTNDPQVIALGTVVLKMVAFNEPFFGLYIITEGIYYGLGQTRYPLYIEFIGMWVVRISTTYFFITMFNAGLTTVWACMIADNVFKAIALAIPTFSLWKRASLCIHEDMK